MSGITRVLRSALASVRELVAGKELVGTDKLGNKYYRWTETAHGEAKERRQVKVGKGDFLYDPNDIPSEWRMWLRKVRTDPPTEEELQRSAAKAEAMRLRVQELERREQAQSFRAKAAGPSAQPTQGTTGLMQQLASKVAQGSDSGPLTPKSPSQDFRPEGWTPPKSNK